MTTIIEKELSYLLAGCIYDVHNEVGPGLREECYQKAMEIRLAQAGIPFIAKPRTRRQLIWLGEVAATFEPDLAASDRILLELKVHPEVILLVYQEFGLGYSDSTYRRLLEIGFRHQGLSCESEVIANPTFRERRLPRSSITPLLIDTSILVQVEAIRDGVSLRAIRTMQTHIGCMNAAVGVVASFGQSRFELRGVRARHERPRE